MNILTIIGHVGNDAIVNQVNGKNVINFSVAVTKRWKDKDNLQKEKTTWFSVSYWSESRVYEWIKKGKQICIVGEAGGRIYVNKQNQTELQLTIDCSIVELLGSSDDKQDNGMTLKDPEEAKKEIEAQKKNRK